MKNIRTNLHDLEKKLNRKLNILIMYFDRNTLVNHRDNSFPTRGHFKHPIENFVDVGKSQIVECLEDWLDVRKTFNSGSSRNGSIIQSSLTKSLCCAQDYFDVILAYDKTLANRVDNPTEPIEIYPDTSVWTIRQIRQGHNLERLYCPSYYSRLDEYRKDRIRNKWRKKKCRVTAKLY